MRQPERASLSVDAAMPPTDGAQKQGEISCVRFASDNALTLAKPPTTRYQQAWRDNNIHDQKQSAKPPSPVQIRAAPPKSSGNFDCLFVRSASDRSQMDCSYRCGATRFPARRWLTMSFVCTPSGGRRFGGPPPSSVWQRCGMTYREAERRPTSSTCSG